MAAKVSAAVRDRHGFLVHRVDSEYQAGQTEIKVLLPDRMKHDMQYPVMYVLPVEAGNGNRYGQGLLEVKKHDLHNKHGVVCVFPTFYHLPWYADHPTDPRIRQESYFLKVVIPAVEERYPVRRDAGGRWLVGFSKSGWGAFSLLLRHPDMFARAAAWDAPMTMDTPNRYGMKAIVATQENFESYRILSLLTRRAEQLQTGTRLGLFGYGNFRSHHQTAHARMQALKIPHEYRDGPRRKHDWHSGWLPEAVRFLSGPPEKAGVTTARQRL